MVLVSLRAPGMKLDFGSTRSFFRSGDPWSGENAQAEIVPFAPDQVKTCVGNVLPLRLHQLILKQDIVIDI